MLDTLDNKPKDEGMEPYMLFVEKSKFVNDWSIPKLVGIVPETEREPMLIAVTVSSSSQITNGAYKHAGVVS